MKLRKTLKVKLGDAEQTLTMSYGMLTELLRISGCAGVEDTTLLIQDLTTRDIVVRRLLTPDLQAQMTSMDQLISPFELELDADTVDDIVGWVLEHFMDFFARSLKVLKTVDERMTAQLTVATA